MQLTNEQLLLQAALQVMIAAAVPLLTGQAATYLYKLNQTSDFLSSVACIFLQNHER